MPKISVLIPNYNHARYLLQRINSVLAQTFNDFEIILLDDCSTDGSRTLIESFANRPLVSKVVFNERNSGSTFKQWEKGIALAKGEWIWIAESDDWCEPTFLQTIMESLEANSRAVVGYCQSYCIENDNDIRFQTTHPKLVDNIDGRSFIQSLMLNGNAIYNASMAVWRKDCYQEISKAFANYKFCGDWLFWMAVAAQGDVIISGRVLNYFRKHNADVSGGAYRSGAAYLEFIRLGTELLEQGLIDNAGYQKFMTYRYHEFLDACSGIDPQTSTEIAHAFQAEPYLRTIPLKRKKARVMHQLKRLLD